MQLLIDIPDGNGITQDIIRKSDWETGSLFDFTIRQAIRDSRIICDPRDISGYLLEARMNKEILDFTSVGKRDGVTYFVQVYTDKEEQNGKTT